MRCPVRQRSSTATAGVVRAVRNGQLREPTAGTRWRHGQRTDEGHCRSISTPTFRIWETLDESARNPPRRPAGNRMGVRRTLCRDAGRNIRRGGSHVQTAKAACAHCTVARQCLRWAITTEIEDEVWGGRTPAERRRISVAFVLDPPPRSRPDVTRPVDVAAPPNPTAAPSGRPMPGQLPGSRSGHHLTHPNSRPAHPSPAPALPPNVERKQATNDTAALTRKPARTADERSAKPRPTVPRGTPPASPSRPAPR